MTTETMTVHKALIELKTLDKRINSAIGAGTFVTTKKNNQDKVAGKTVDEFNTNAKSAFQSVWDLILRRNAIKDALNVSNAVTKVKIGELEYTVVEAIDKKNHGMDFYVTLRDTLMTQLSNGIRALEKNNQSLQQKAEEFLAAMSGGKETKTKGEEYDTQINYYIKSNTMELIDPIGLEKKIKELDDMINSFLPEVDAALSVSNALTTISISY